MQEVKIWKSYDKNDDKIIACYNATIYKANPATEEIDNIANEFKKTKNPASFFNIPFSYIREIRLQDKKNHIEILFAKNSSEHFRITNDEKKNELFEFLQANIPNSTCTTEHYSKLKSGKKPLTALFTVTLIFLWTYYTAEAIECNPQYYVTGSPNSLYGLVIALATLGTITVTIIFSILILIAILAFIIKAKNPPTIKIIRVKR